MTFRKKLEKWLDNPNTPPDAWMQLSFPQIDKQAGVNLYNACVQFPKILAKRMGKSVCEVRDIRMEFHCRQGLA